MDMPISEGAFMNMAVGCDGGREPVVEFMFSDFVSEAMDGIVNRCENALYDRRTGKCAAGDPAARVRRRNGAAAQHSQSLEAWFCHVPGLKVVMPAAAAMRQDSAHRNPGRRAGGIFGTQAVL